MQPAKPSPTGFATPHHGFGAGSSPYNGPPAKRSRTEEDSTKPTCQNCAKYGLVAGLSLAVMERADSRNPQECVYPVKMKPGLRPGTGVDMSKRLEQLEDRIATYEARLREQEAALAQLTRWQSSQVSQPATVPTPSGSMAPSGFRLDPHQQSNSGAHMTPAAPSTDPSFDVQPSPGGLSVASFLDPHVLPGDDIVQSLISLYYTHIWPWAPIIPKQTFSAPWSITVHAMVVVSLRLSDDSRLAGVRTQLRAAAKSHVLSHAIESTSIASIQALALLALDIIGSEQSPSSWGVLALLTRSAVHLGLMTEDERSRGSGSERGRVGPLSRTSIVPPPQTGAEDEARRRLFWLIYILDRYSSASTGWDFALRDADIRRRLPSSDALWAAGEWVSAPFFAPVLHRDRFSPSQLASLSPMAFLIEAVDLLGRAHTLQSRPDGENGEEFKRDAAITLSASARRWYQDLPPLDGSIGLCVKGIYHATMLKINAYYAYPALGGTQQPFERNCLESCEAMVDLCLSAQRIGWKSASPWFIWSAWVSARVLFISRFVARNGRRDSRASRDMDLEVRADGRGMGGGGRVGGDGRDALEGKEAWASPVAGVTDDPSFAFVLECLHEAAQYWGLASQYVRLLEAAKRKLQRNEYEPLNLNDNDSLPDAIHVLLDLRRTAYNAVGHAGDNSPNPEMNLNDLPAWAVQPLLGDLHNWFDLPAGLFAEPS